MKTLRSVNRIRRFFITRIPTRLAIRWKRVNALTNRTNYSLWAGIKECRYSSWPGLTLRKPISTLTTTWMCRSRITLACAVLQECRSQNIRTTYIIYSSIGPLLVRICVFLLVWIEELEGSKEAGGRIFLIQNLSLFNSTCLSPRLPARTKTSNYARVRTRTYTGGPPTCSQSSEKFSPTADHSETVDPT